MKQTVEEAAKKARMASAETLTTYGTHRSLDDLHIYPMMKLQQLPFRLQELFLVQPMDIKITLRSSGIR